MNASIMLLFYGAIFAVIYFFFIRPQSQKIKEGKKFIDEVQKGDKVVTTGGIHGIIDVVEETTFLLRVWITYPHESREISYLCRVN
jgi:preprotein translocase subunit YajC